MLARRSTIVHPMAGEVELPLLVPAFSSKGFELRKAGDGRGHDYTGTVYDLETFAKFPSEAALVSAYDLHFGHFESVPDLPDAVAEEYLRNTRLVFLDSGGYELVPDFDATEPRTFAYRPKSGFGLDEYKRVLERLTTLESPLPLVVANFDFGTRRRPFDDQIEAARDLFGMFDSPLTSFIIKPWKKNGKVVEPRDLSDTDYANLRGFNIIGVTEKELGTDMLKRLKAVARLRRGLDDAGVSAPIHVWGGLDPIMTPLFFFAGAEIFDGVSWLRYAYKNGVAMNREVHAILSRDMGLSASNRENHAYASMENLSFMKELPIALQQWLDFEATKFDMFDPAIAPRLESAYRLMTTRIDLLRGGT